MPVAGIGCCPVAVEFDALVLSPVKGKTVQGNGQAHSPGLHVSLFQRPMGDIAVAPPGGWQRIEFGHFQWTEAAPADSNEIISACQRFGVHPQPSLAGYPQHDQRTAMGNVECHALARPLRPDNRRLAVIGLAKAPVRRRNIAVT
ncbi:hypothetical protein D3C71_1818370 [compost metagenome]